MWDWPNECDMFEAQPPGTHNIRSKPGTPRHDRKFATKKVHLSLLCKNAGEHKLSIPYGPLHDLPYRLHGEERKKDNGGYSIIN
ncbi:hypothetical protein BC936DRAFT_147800 [Jimgerdemannia flammicorona]|uniref:Uncharacterized protein n=1 Tax=Jimgerdemannia flammicorona TaxID=994334 RepID=A0A433D4G4_9FUNG|nr:hypothetical protein BC936DRAFT_147800 [Jimgerdemannia flammicorona]